VGDTSQGVKLATEQALAGYWAVDYGWRKAEARLKHPAELRHRDRRRMVLPGNITDAR
jgi:hypothetical protein